MTFDIVSELASPTGARLALRHQPAEGDARAILLLHHGLSEHSGRHLEFARFMGRRGFHIYAHDHRGHGLTQAGDAPRGVFAAKHGVKAVLGDCLAVREAAARRHAGLPVVVFGHSMGGLVALNFVEAFPDRLDALAVWNANPDGGLPAAAAKAVLSVERMLLGSDVPSPMLPRFTFEAWDRRSGGNGSSSAWLSSRPEVAEAYLADPLCGFRPSISMWLDVFEMIVHGRRLDAMRRLPRALPLHLAGGSADPSTDYGQSVRRLADRLRRAGLTDVTLRIHDHLRHETLNEPNAEMIMSEFAMWADHAVAPLAATRRQTLPTGA